MPARHTNEKQLLPLGISDPTVGFVSPTRGQGVTLDQTLNDGIRDIVVGRAAVQRYDTLVNEWRTNGGETIRKEYQDAITAAK